jgi:hypothetical protein
MGTSCSAEGCDRTAIAKGFCSRCYQRQPEQVAKRKPRPESGRERDLETARRYRATPKGKATLEALYERNRDARTAASLRYHASERGRARSHGLSLEEFQELWDQHGGRCHNPGCRRDLADGWHVDHDHACCDTGRSCGHCVRGLLCPECNKAAGQLGDDAARARGLATYLDETRYNKV